MYKQKLWPIICLALFWALLGGGGARSAPVHTTYLWHMQQPIYWPDRSTWDPVTYEKAYETITLGHSQSDVYGIFNKDDRVADYQWYPHDAISSILSVPDAGAQVSFSGCLVENVQSLAQAGWNGGRYAPDWYADYREARSWGTSGGRPRLDLVLVTYHHCLGPLVDENALRKEVELYKQLYPQTWGTSPGLSQGFFPTETSFSERMIKVLVEEGIDWTFVANVHLSRACADYPWVANEDNIDPPNPADQTNPAQGYYWSEAISRGITTHNPPPFAYQPHWAKWVDPETGEEYRLIVVPTAQAMGWNDSYASHGTDEIDAIAPYNDPEHPMLIVLSHDGDNAYSGGYSYYNESVPNFVQAALAKGYEPTTVEEYLADHPPDTNDVVHIEDGSWVYADNDFGHPQCINWNWPLVNANGDFDIPGGWAIDERNWAVITAAENRVETAEAIAGGVDISKIQDPTSAGASDAELAWHFFLPALTSGYMYYGSALDMEVKPTLASNEAVYHADLVIGDGSADQTPPTIWLPQRLPYNPGGIGAGPLWGYQEQPMPREFWVWTFVYDVSGLSSVVLKYRLDLDGLNPLSSNENETYMGGPGVGPWRSLPMTKRAFPKGNFFNDPNIDFSELPTYIADEYWAQVTDTDIVSSGGRLVDYWVEATDSLGWVKRSPIQHVWVGTGGTAQDTIVYWVPGSPSPGDSVTIYYDPVAGALPDSTDPVYIHIGHSGWQEIVEPDPQMVFEDSIGYWSYTYQIPTYATSVDFCFNDGQGNWDNNQGNDWHIQLGGGAYQMDGQLDDGVRPLAVNNADTLWVDISGSQLYLATNLQSGSTEDRFIFLAQSPGALVDAPWLKSGKVASFDAYLAREGENGWTGWFENQGAAQSAGGKVLEGWIDLQGEFGSPPDTVYLALGIYQTPDYGSLVSQVPHSLDGDGDIDGDEYIPYTEGNSPILYINELLALNDSVNQDEAGDYDGWIELYNPDSSEVNLGGMWLTDDLGNPTRWQIPDTAIAPGGYLLFWADSEGAEGPLHTDFKLNNQGGWIGLFDPSGSSLLDSVGFGPQSPDTSWGRYPDGGSEWEFFPNPTPGGSNIEIGIRPGPGSNQMPTEFALGQNYPNPFNSTTLIHYQLSADRGRPTAVTLRVYNILGQEVKTLVEEEQAPGYYSVRWNGRDSQGKEVPSGIYFYRLKAESQKLKAENTRKMILLR